MVVDLDLQKRIIFDSVPHPEVDKCYQSSDVFVSTSLTGSVDKAVLEAMACGKPVIVCNRAFFNVLGDYSKILMFGKKNPSDLAAKILHVLKMNKKSRERLCHSMEEIVGEKHSINGLAEKLVNVFSQVIKK
jgi:glycosyltransferase involved in cell wall biosynthesis